MKRKNKKLIIPAFILGGALLLSGGIALASGLHADTPVQAEVVVNVDGELESSYAFGTEFSIPACVIRVDGVEYAASATLKTPGGQLVKGGSVTLNESGVYTLEYCAVVNGKPYVQTYMFEVMGRTVQYAGTNTQVYYGTYDKYEADSEGLIVRLENGDSLTFTQLFDMSSLDKNTTIIKGFVTPDVQGVADFETIEFTFTDAENPDITLTVIGNFSGNIKAYGLTYFTAAGNGQIPCGLEAEGKLHVNNGLGAAVLHSFVAQDTGEYFGAKDPTAAAPDAKQFTVSYDNATKQVWAGGKFVSDLDDADYYSSFWLGFPSGKARLSIKGKNYAGLTANFCLTEVLGVDLTKDGYEDVKAPVITVENDYETMPTARVGGSYPVAAATAYDEVDGVRDVSVSVWYDYTSDSAIMLNVADGKFKTEKAGNYAIVYEATDKSGNVAREVLWVKANTDVPELKLEKTGEISSVKIGEWLTVPEPTVIGGSGESVWSATAYCGDLSCEVKDGGFRPEKVGEWTVEYLATDYIGSVATLKVAVSVSENPNPVFVDLPVLPVVMICGSTYTIPELYVNDYTSGSLDRKLCSVEVRDASGVKTYAAGDSFLPTVEKSGDEVSFVFKTNSAVSEEYKVPAIEVWKWDETLGMNLLHTEEYLYGTGFEAQADYRVGDTTGIRVMATEKAERNGFRFANPQNAEQFSIEFKTIVGASGFTGMELVLTDSVDPTISIVATLMKADGKTALTVDGVTVLLNNDFDARTNETFEIGYSNNSFVINGTTAMSVTKMVNGGAFDGFPSGRAYFDLNMLNAEVGAAYMLYLINGAQVSNILDTIQPTVAILGDYGGMYGIGDTYAFARAVGCDIHAPNVSVYMTVKAPDGSVVTATDGTALDRVIPSKEYFAKLSQYGTYTVTYTAKEEGWETNNSFSLNYIFYVMDEIAPEIVFSGEFQTTAKVGETLVIPDFTVSDNHSAVEEITVVKSVYNPLGKLILLSGDTNAIVCQHAGEYEFRILVVDAVGNTTLYKAVVTVTE